MRFIFRLYLVYHANNLQIFCVLLLHHLHGLSVPLPQAAARTTQETCPRLRLRPRDGRAAPAFSWSCFGGTRHARFRPGPVRSLPPRSRSPRGRLLSLGRVPARRPQQAPHQAPGEPGGRKFSRARLLSKKTGRCHAKFFIR